MTPDYSFLRVAASLTEQQMPELWRMVQPRRIVAPTGWPSPRLASSLFCAHATFTALPKSEITKSMVDCALIAWKLIEEGMPAYMVGEDFIDALTHTDPPQDMLLSDMQWPFEAITFYLPERWACAYFKRAVPYVSVARQPVGLLDPPPQLARIYPGMRRSGIDITDGYQDTLAFCTNAAVLFNDKPVDYASSWAMKESVHSLLNESKFQDYTKGGILTPEETAPEHEDLFLIRRINSVAVWLLLSMQAAPEYIEEAQAIRPAKIKRGVLVKDELWAPRWLGRRYTWEREPLGGTHASPRLHRKRGHMKHVVHGPQRSLRKLQWIKPYWVGAKAA